MTREDAIKIINCYDIGFYDLSGAKIPADKLADAFDMAIEALSADRPTGEWKGYKADNPNWLRTDGTPIFLVCDKCNCMVMNNGSANWNYCPNCGARMKGGEDA